MLTFTKTKITVANATIILNESSQYEKKSKVGGLVSRPIHSYFQN